MLCSYQTEFISLLATAMLSLGWQAVTRSRNRAEQWALRTHQGSMVAPQPSSPGPPFAGSGARLNSVRILSS